MVDQEKIILMTKLAVNDKKYTKKDMKITTYYKEDYIYINNFKTRCLVFCVVSVGVVLDVLFKIEKGINIPTTPDAIFTQYIVPYGSFLVVMLIIYTLLSSIVYTKRYNEAQKRVHAYDKILNQLEKHESNKSI